MYLRAKILTSSALVLASCLALSGCGAGSGNGTATSTSPSANPIPTDPLQFPDNGPSSAPVPQIAVPETGIKQDAAKYPQDTPDKALDSIAKALESNDLAYQIAWLFTPDHTQRLMEKYKTVDAAVAANQTENMNKAHKVVLETIRKMQANKKMTQGTVNGVEWVDFKLGENEVVQLERQKDGRWCWNTTKKEPKK